MARNGGWCIVNDTVFITNPTHAQLKARYNSKANTFEILNVPIYVLTLNSEI